MKRISATGSEAIMSLLQIKRGRTAAPIFGLILFCILLLIPFMAQASEVFHKNWVFEDVPDNHPFVSSVTEMKSKGYVAGYPDGTFAPERTISRAEFITMVMAAVAKDRGYALVSADCFADVKKENWFARFVCTAKAQGWVKGIGENRFNPDANINLAEASAVLSKAFRLYPRARIGSEPWYKPSLTRLSQLAAVPVTIDSFAQFPSRSEIAEMIWRLKVKLRTKPTKSYASLASPFPSMASCAELGEKLAVAQYRSTRGRQYAFEMLAPTMATPMTESEDSAGAEEGTPAPDASSKSSESPEYSTTNVQVEGVDEGDIVKNDGGFIYIVSGTTVRVVKAYPPAELKEVARQKFDDNGNAGFNPIDLYVYGDKLVVIGQGWGPSAGEGNRSQIMVYVFAMDANRSLTQERKLTFDGSQISSRRIGNRFYLVLNYSPDIYNFRPMEASAPQKILPHFRDFSVDDSVRPLVPCEKVHFLPNSDETNFVTAVSFDLSSADSEVKRESIMGAGDTVYASLESLYVAGARHDYPIGIRFDVWQPPQSQEKTVLYRFSFESDGSVKYVTKGEVKGRILNQFSLDEYGSSFRIATTTGEVWNRQEKSKNHLFILDRADLTKTLGKIEDIAPGERIYSVRFIGKRAYMVTFKKVDPFFVIDVENPSAPKILGELKIPGFSDYLHPFDENHIIGFGKDTVEPGELEKAGFNNDAFDFAWYQGMKIALFDVTDVANPTMLFKEVIGDRGTDSELLRNHKALYYDKTRGIFAFPVTVAEIKDKDAGSYTGSVYGEPVFQGAYIYSLDLENGFQLKGKVTHYNSGEDLARYVWGGGAKAIQRILSIGEYLYTVSFGKVKAVSRSEISAVGEVELEYSESNSGIIY